MLEFLHARLSVLTRLGIIVALLCVPVAYLTYAFVNKASSGDINAAKTELDGTRYLTQVWPSFFQTAATNAPVASALPDAAKFDAELSTSDTSAPFVQAKDVGTKLSAGRDFIAAVADGAGLTLDPDADSYFVQDAATLRIPDVVDAANALGRAAAEPASNPRRIIDIAKAQQHLQQTEIRALSSLNKGMKNNAAGITKKTLSSAVDSFKSAVDDLNNQGESLLNGGDAKGLDFSLKKVFDASDALWMLANNETARLLQARIDGIWLQIEKTLAISISTVIVAVALSLVIGTGLSSRILRLVGVMDRLVENDATVEVPYLNYTNETGHIAQSLKSFRDAVVERASLRSDKNAIEQLAAEREATARQNAEIALRQTQVVERVASSLDRLANADLTVAITEAFPEEFDRLRTDLNTAARQLRTALETIDSTANSIHTDTEQLTRAVDTLQGRSEQQAASLEETAAALNQIVETVRKSAEGASHARRVVAGADENAKRSVNVVKQAVDAMAGISKSADQISQIIGLMDEIAFQTNLLALNAGVEAARAGEAGRGFAVVASEVRALAQRSAEAAKEIKTLISSSATQVDLGVKLVAETRKSLETIMSQVAEINGVVTDMANGASEQATSLNEVNIAITQMDQVTQENAAMVEESTAACHHLAQEVQELSHLVAKFRLHAGDKPSTSRRAA